MSSVYRGSSMMAMLDGQKPEEQQKASGEYWGDGDANYHLSPVRKHLISNYLQVPEDEPMPLLGEYFGVALSFMALGALVRASNSTKKKQKRTTEEERMDLRSCSRFQRMALESMLKEAMERLKTLSQNAYHLEERVRDLTAEDVALDKERVQLLMKLADTEKTVAELKALRKAEGKANERVMCIVSTKEQDWLKEKRNLQKELQRLKETLSNMTREAKFQARRCRNPTCEHCKGIDRVVRNVKGRISLRELNNTREALAAASAAAGKRDVPKVDGHLEVEEDRVLIRSLEHKKKQSELPGHLKNQNKVEKHVEWHDSASSSRIASGGFAGLKESAKQQQDLELANILKRVGMLKQRSNSSNPIAILKEGSSMEEKKIPLEDKKISELPKGEVLDSPQLEGKVEVQESSVSESDIQDPTAETAYNSSDQEDYFSVEEEEEEDSDLVELEKALESRKRREILKSQEAHQLISDNRAIEAEIQSDVGEPSEAVSGMDAGIPMSTEKQQQLHEDAEFAAFERSLGFSGIGGELHGRKSITSTVEDSIASEQPKESNQLAQSDGFLDVSGTYLDAPRYGIPATESEPAQLSDTKITGSTQNGHEDTEGEETMEVQSSDDDYDGEGLQYHDSLGEYIVEELDEEPGVQKAAKDQDPEKSPEGGKGIQKGAEVVESIEYEQISDVEFEEATHPSDEISSPLDTVTAVASDQEDLFAVDVDLSEEDDQDHSDLGFQDNLNLQNRGAPTGEGVLENQDIPVFERDNVDDLAGELPEPEEKRVCGPEILDSSVTGSTENSQEEVGNLKDTAWATVELKERNQSDCPKVEELGLVSDEKVTSEKVSEVCEGQELSGIRLFPESG